MLKSQICLVSYFYTRWRVEYLMSMPHARSRRSFEKQKFNRRRNCYERVTIVKALEKFFEIRGTNGITKRKTVKQKEKSSKRERLFYFSFNIVTKLPKLERFFNEYSFIIFKIFNRKIA